jgi:hypothetical protein
VQAPLSPAAGRQALLAQWAATRARAQAAWHLQVAADAWSQVRRTPGVEAFCTMRRTLLRTAAGVADRTGTAVNLQRRNRGTMRLRESNRSLSDALMTLRVEGLP